MAHLVQKCRDDDFMSYESCAAYLRKNAILIDHTTIVRPPRKLLHVSEQFSQYESEEENTSPTKSIEEVTKLFHTMCQESGLRKTYNTFQSKTF